MIQQRDHLTIQNMEDTPESTHGNALFFFMKQSPSVSCTTSYGFSHFSGHEDGFHFRCLPSHVLCQSQSWLHVSPPQPLSSLASSRFQLPFSRASCQRTHTQPPSPLPDAKTLSGQQRVCSASILSLRIRCGSDWKCPTPAHAPRSPGNPSTCGRKPGEARFLRPQSHWTWSACSLDGSFLLGCYLEQFPQTLGFTGLASPPPGAWWDRARRSGTWSEQRGLDPTGGQLLRHITKHILESWHLPAGLNFKLC